MTALQTSEADCKPRRVFHYHFTQWPDHGVPASKLCLISFIKRVRKQHPPEGPPLVVHCSAGVGRTGTFIVLDTMLQRMEIEGDLKVYDFVTQLRKRRTLMVQNIVSAWPLDHSTVSHTVCHYRLSTYTFMMLYQNTLHVETLHSLS